jgi:hypothetical protein
MNEKGIEFSFGWIFSLIIGAAIIFLAVYAAVKLVGTERGVQSAELSKQLDVILTPIETGYESGKSVTPLEFPSETRIYNDCTLEGNFGAQKIIVDASSGIGGKWQNVNVLTPSVSYNKYVFSDSVVQGKRVMVFSKPFSMPFKIANLLFLYADKYCFVNSPSEIEREITSTRMENINMTDDLTKCPKQSKRVCFNTEEPQCNVIVNTEQKSVQKNNSVVYYEGALIYGAILSAPSLYECQVTRLMKRASELTMLYNAKSENIAASTGGCSSDLQGYLQSFATITGGTNSSAALREIFFMAEEIKAKNSGITKCKLWDE